MSSLPSLPSLDLRMRANVIDLTFNQDQLSHKQDKENTIGIRASTTTRSIPHSHSHSHSVKGAGFKFQKKKTSFSTSPSFSTLSLSSSSQENFSLPSSHSIQGVSVSFNSSPLHSRSEGKLISRPSSSQIEIDSATLARNILKEQEEVLEILENSTFVTNLLSRTSTRNGMTEQQHFIRAFEEVERAKQRLLIGQYSSHDSFDEIDLEGLSISMDSLELSPRNIDLEIPFEVSIPSPSKSLKAEIFQEMGDLLSESDDEEENQRDIPVQLDHIERELQRRYPSKLQFRGTSGIEVHKKSQAPSKRQQRYEINANSSDSDYEANEKEIDPMEFLQEDPKSDQRNSMITGKGPLCFEQRIFCLVIGSLSEWLVMCIRSYPSVFLNEKETEIEDRNGMGNLYSNLERCARRYLQVEKYMGKMEKEIEVSVAVEKKRSKKKIEEKLTKIKGNKMNVRGLMSQSVSNLPPSPEEKSINCEVSSAKDDDGINYRIFSKNSQKERKILQKGNILLLSAAISLGDLAGQIVVWETLGHD